MSPGIRVPFDTKRNTRSTRSVTSIRTPKGGFVIEQIIHFTVPANSSPDQERNIELARRLHPDWKVMVWRDPVDTSGFQLSSYHGKVNSGAQLADLIRLDVVCRHGGVYLDSDIELCRPLDDLCRGEDFFCSEDGQNLTNAAFGARRGHPVIQRLIDELLAHEPDWRLPPNVSTGPQLFSRLLRWQEGITLLPRDTFYPYNWNETPIEALTTTYGVHRWAASWKSPVPAATGIIARESTHPAWHRGLRRLLRRGVQAVLNEYRRHHAPPVLGHYAYGQDLIVNTTRGLRLSLPGADLSITPEIALTGTYEEVELRFLERLLRGGDLFIDVGCNVGIFSLVAARRVGAFGRVHAFDANPGMLSHLKRSLVMNWLVDRVVLHHRAVGASSGEVTFVLADTCAGGSHVSAASNGDALYHRITEGLSKPVTTTVPMVRLDEKFMPGQEIKLLKIDVEGHEHDVLAGASRLIESRCVAHIMLELIEEVSPEAFQLNMAAVRAVMAHGYGVATLDDDGSLVEQADLAQAVRDSRNVVLFRR